MNEGVRVHGEIKEVCGGGASGKSIKGGKDRGGGVREMDIVPTRHGDASNQLIV